MQQHAGAIVDLTVAVRPHRADYLGHVQVGHDVDTGRVVVVLDHDYADQLAGFLAQVDTNPDRQRDAALTTTREHQDVWMHALVDILASRAAADSRHSRLAGLAAAVAAHPAGHPRLALVADAAHERPVDVALVRHDAAEH